MNNLLAEALKRLVDLKDLKDREGKSGYYETHQPAAWEQARKALAQYNAVEPEKKQEIKKLDGLHELLIGHLDKMNIASQELFDEKKSNPKNKKSGLQDAWNKLAMFLFDSKVTVQTIREMQSSSQSPQTPIDTEPEEELWDCVWSDWQFSGYAQWREKMQSKFHITRK